MKNANETIFISKLQAWHQSDYQTGMRSDSSNSVETLYLGLAFLIGADQELSEQK